MNFSQRCSALLRHPLAGACLLAGAILIAGAAASHNGENVAVIDTTRVRMESKVIQSQLNAASAPAAIIQENFKAKRAQLGTAVEDYRAQKSVTSDAINKQRTDAIQKLTDELNKIVEDYNKALGEAGAKDLPELRAKIIDAVEWVAHERGIKLVLSNEGSVYVAPDLDLTDAVVAKIDGE